LSTRQKTRTVPKYVLEKLDITICLTGSLLQFNVPIRDRLGELVGSVDAPNFSKGAPAPKKDLAVEAPSTPDEDLKKAQVIDPEEQRFETQIIDPEEESEDLVR
jgi:hypothetical protein